MQGICMVEDVYLAQFCDVFYFFDEASGLR